jgi:preprotein translocase subunit SecA
MMAETVTAGVLEFCPERTYSEEWDWDGVAAWYRELTGIDGFVEETRGEVENPHSLADMLTGRALEVYGAKEADLGPDGLRDLESQVMLRVIDTRWMDHLQEMDYLKEGIGLRAMGQRDPIIEYKTEAFSMFGELVQAINEDFLRTIMHIEVIFEPQPQMVTSLNNASYSAPSENSIFGAAAAAADQFGLGGPSQDQIASAAAAAGGARIATVVKDANDPWANVGRNDPCPCGSGMKYKKCHGAQA